MLRLTVLSFALLVCATHANLFGSLLEDKNMEVLSVDMQETPPNQEPTQELAVIGNDEPLSEIADDLALEGQSGVVIRAKRYYGCGCGCCGCCGCATMAPAATMMPCGCGCCGCGYGK